MLYHIFTQILNMSITASVVIIVILFIHSMMHKLPKKYLYLLWTIVGIRLLCPVAIPSSVSLFNIAGTDFKVSMKSSTQDQRESSDMADNGKPAENILQDTTISETLQREHQLQNEKFNSLSENAAPVTNIRTAKVQTDKLNPVVRYGAIIWLAGMAVIFLRNLYITLQVKKCLRKAVRYQKNIYECDNIPSPFVIGILHPKIYIPFRLGDAEREYILEHEQYHIKRKDYITKFVAFLLTCLYWFHPLVWLAYFLMIRDMEMSCDEYVLQNASDDIRTSYSKSLLGFAMNKRGIAVGLLAFGETNTRKRVKNVLHFQKYKKGVSIIAVILLIIAGIICLTNAKDNNKKPSAEKNDINTRQNTTDKTSNNKSDNNAAAQNITLKENNLYIFEKLNVSIKLPENPNWIQNPKAFMDKKIGVVTYHNEIAETDVTLRFGKKGQKDISRFANDDSSPDDEYWSYFSDREERFIHIKFYTAKNNITTVVLSWEYNNISFYMEAEFPDEKSLGKEAVGDWQSLAKSAAFIANNWCDMLNKAKTQSFSDSDIKNAKKTVRQYFRKKFQDCELRKLWYDEKRYKNNISNFSENYGTDNVIIIYSNFYVSKKCKINSLNKNFTYKNFMWVLSKGTDSGWKVQTYGY